MCVPPARWRRRCRSVRGEAMQRAERHLAGGEFGDMVGRSAVFVALCTLLDELAASDDRVLITGETGTGKGLAARRLHASGPRRDGPFVKVNSAGLPDSLLESELFGHEAGAFTGAVRRHRGCFERAHGGTLFLDEIGAMAPAAQARLLAAVEDGAVQPLGSETPVTVDVRVVAATNRDPEVAVACGALCADLFWRLAHAQVHLPPLRERPEDIEPIAAHLLERIAAVRGRATPTVTPDALARLAREPWPGNVRELETRLRAAWRRASRGPTIETDHLDPPISPQPPVRPVPADDPFPPPDWSPRMPDGARKREIVEAALALAGPSRGQYARAAATLGVWPETVRRIRQRPPRRPCSAASGPHG